MDRHERLSYHAPRVAAEPGPVRAELKLHGNARADADCEIDSKDPDPEAGSIVPALPVWPEAPRLHEDNQEGQAHGELGEQIVIDDGERELEAVNEKITHFACPLEHTGPPQASIGSTVRMRTAPSTSAPRTSSAAFAGRRACKRCSEGKSRPSNPFCSLATDPSPAARLRTLRGDRSCGAGRETHTERPTGCWQTGPAQRCRCRDRPAADPSARGPL